MWVPPPFFAVMTMNQQRKKNMSEAAVADIDEHDRFFAHWHTQHT